MVLLQFPFGATAEKEINVGTGDSITFTQPRVQQGVFHNFSNRKVHIKVLNIVYSVALSPYVPPLDLYRIDFYNMQMIGNPVVVQGNGAQGTHCSSGIMFSNNAAQYGLAGAPYEFDAWLQGPLLIADILPHTSEPRDFCPILVSSGLGHAHLTLDVTLLE